MQLLIFEDRLSLARAAAQHAARVIRDAIARNGSARIVAATAASQLEFLDVLLEEPGIHWPSVEVFHLDEYVGLPATHPSSFRRILLDRFLLRAGVTRYHLLEGDADDVEEAARTTGELLRSHPVNIAFVGIGENGHLAFNDPPADFDVEAPYILVDLDQACREQQVAEGWFKTMDDVPRRAISMSIRQILQARSIVAIVPGKRKAEAVRSCIEGAIDPSLPASILRTHADVALYLDADSAALLHEGPRN